jgi:hypothetical protein
MMNTQEYVHGNVELNERMRPLTRGLWGALVILTLAVWIKAVMITYPVWFDFNPEDKAVLQQIGLSGAFIGNCMFALEIIWALTLFGVAILLFLQKSNDLEGVLLSAALITLVPGGSAGNELMRNPQAWGWPAMFLDSIGVIIFLLAIYRFPDGRFVPKWLQRLILFLIGFGILSFMVNGIAWSQGEASPLHNAVAMIQVIGGILFAGIGIYAQIYRYKKIANDIQRKQIKMWLTGIITALMAFTVYNVWHVLLFPALGLPLSVFWSTFLVFELIYTLGFLALPLSLSFSVLKYS